MVHVNITGARGTDHPVFFGKNKIAAENGITFVHILYVKSKRFIEILIFRNGQQDCDDDRRIFAA